jgi:hypothetical protein
LKVLSFSFEGEKKNECRVSKVSALVKTSNLLKRKKKKSNLLIKEKKDKSTLLVSKVSALVYFTKSNHHVENF